MLQAKGLEKVYRSKRGVATYALKGINLDFTESGLFFYSGSRAAENPLS